MRRPECRDGRDVGTPMPFLFPDLKCITDCSVRIILCVTSMRRLLTMII